MDIQNDQNDVPGQVRLKDLKNGLYQIHSSKHGAFEGALNPIFWEAVSWGVETKELNYAVKHLAESGDDYADFGVFGSFMFSGRNKKVS